MTKIYVYKGIPLLADNGGRLSLPKHRDGYDAQYNELMHIVGIDRFVDDVDFHSVFSYIRETDEDFVVIDAGFVRLFSCALKAGRLIFESFRSKDEVRQAAKFLYNNKDLWLYFEKDEGYLAARRLVPDVYDNCIMVKGEVVAKDRRIVRRRKLLLTVCPEEISTEDGGTYSV